MFKVLLQHVLTRIRGKIIMLKTYRRKLEYIILYIFTLSMYMVETSSSKIQ